MSNGAEFASYLRRNSKWRTGLLDAVGAPDDHLYVYYLCPLNHLDNIMIAGIMCHDDPLRDTSRLVDLSSPEVQAKRHSVTLGKFNDRRYVFRVDTPVHSCINLFWNPLNWTLDAFQRNAIIAAEAADQRELAVVCIIEIDVGEILRGDKFYWCATNRNLAGNRANVQCTSEALCDQSTFNWQAIFGSKAVQTREDNAVRSAEFLVYQDGDSLVTNPLPSDYFLRIICSDEYKDIVDTWSEAAGISINIETASVFKDTKSLLHAEVKLVESLAHKRDTRFHDAFLAALSNIVEVEDMTGGLVEADFAMPEMAYHVHGIGHTVRVMFWTAVMAQYSGMADGEILAAVLAARYHDLCRTSNADGLSHAEAASRKFSSVMRDIVGDHDLAARGLASIEQHDREDGEVIDIILRVLKDGDALDRGRFGIPGDGNCSGCDVGRLRTRGVRSEDDSYRNVAWAAYWLYRMTTHTVWDLTPCRAFARQIGYGLKAAIRADESPEGDSGELFNGLSDLLLAERIAASALDAASQ